MSAGNEGKNPPPEESQFYEFKDKQLKLLTNWRGKAYFQCTIIHNLDNDRHFKRETMRDYLHLRILGALPISSEREGSPMINLAYFKNK